MANTRKVLLSLHDEVVDRLDQEPNKSALMDALAAAHYGLNFEGSTVASSNRQSLLDSLRGTVTPAPEVSTDVVPTTTTAPVVEAVELPSDVITPPAEPEPVAPQRGEVQPEVGFVPVVAQETDFVPLVEPLAEAEPTVAPVVEPVQPEEVTPVVEAPAPEPTPSLVEAVAATEPLVTETPIENLPVAPPEVVADPVVQDEPGYEPGTTLNPDGQKICPTCKEVMLTPVCLNCL